MKRTKRGRDRLTAAVLVEQVLPLEKVGWTPLTWSMLKNPQNNPIHGLCSEQMHMQCSLTCRCFSSTTAMDKDINFARCHKVRMVELRLVEEA